MCLDTKRWFLLSCSLGWTCYASCFSLLSSCRHSQWETSPSMSCATYLGLRIGSTKAKVTRGSACSIYRIHWASSKHSMRWQVMCTQVLLLTMTHSGCKMNSWLWIIRFFNCKTVLWTFRRQISTKMNTGTRLNFPDCLFSRVKYGDQPPSKEPRYKHWTKQYSQLSAIVYQLQPIW